MVSAFGKRVPRASGDKPWAPSNENDTAECSPHRGDKHDPEH